MTTENLTKLSKLIVKTGVNIKTDDILVITSPIEASDFARNLSSEAYNLGAKEVIVHYTDQKLTKIKLMNSTVETISNVPSWVSESYTYYAKKGAAFISISGSDPDGLNGIEIEKLSANNKSRSIALKEFYSYTMSNKCKWCVASYPSLEWAKKVFPNLSDEEAIDALSEAILNASRATGNPIENWENHNNNLKQKREFLNDKNLKSITLTSKNGTNLNIQLPYNHEWAGGTEVTTSGENFNANIPTEEIFTLPLKTGVNGTVFSSKPLSYCGNLINDFNLTFKDGKVVDFSAKEGYEILEQLLNTDEGSRYLGEIALVPFDSPISNSNITFFNTLFDENASCHLAFGEAYPCFKDANDLNKEQLIERGANHSLIHVDFMIGTSDLNIVGVTNEGAEIEIFKDGNWTF